MKRKHRKDKNHGKGGLCSGNPRYNRANEKDARSRRDKIKNKTMAGW